MSSTPLTLLMRLGLYHVDEVNDEGFEASYFEGVAKDDNLWGVSKDDWRKGVGTQRDSMICCGQFITMIAKRMGLLTDEVLNSLSAPIYYRALDAIILKEMIGPDGRLIAEDPAPGVPRVAMPRGPRLSMQDLYDRMGNMEIL
nr:hypothetical protein [Tanacetum cinerariifolium]